MSGPRGVLYFGAILGVGLLTDMATPLVYGGAALALNIGPGAALISGIGFGLGRSLPGWVAVVVGPLAPPSRVAVRMISAVHWFRWPGAAIGILGLYLTVLAPDFT